MSDHKPTEITLDPQDWESLRALGHTMLDDMLDYLKNVRERPVWQPIPADVKALLNRPLPRQPQEIEAVYQQFTESILPHPMGNIHPRFWGWVIGTGTPSGMLAEMLAAGMNPNLGGGDHVANYVESQVLDWSKEMLGYPSDASGLLVSGASMANLVGLAVARNVKAGYDLRRDGLAAAKRPLTLYASQETHNSVQKAVELLGLGSQALRLIPVNDQFQIDQDVLEATITADRQAGYQPFCIVGNAGTVNTGAFDDLETLGDICAREQLWFHVDGAFGALAALSPELRPLVGGMQRADSLTFDFHKWMHIPFEAGCILVRQEPDHRQAFALSADYLAHNLRGLAAGKHWFSEYGVQLSRGFRALKIWFALMEHGIETYGRLVQQNVDQARYLGDLVERNQALECLAPASLNIVCFRFNPGGVDDETLNDLNKELLVQLHESGIAAPSYTTLNGRYALRVCITNHRSRTEDFDLLVREVLRLGQELILAVR